MRRKADELNLVQAIAEHVVRAADVRVARRTLVIVGIVPVTIQHATVLDQIPATRHPRHAAVVAVQAMEAILAEHAAGRPNAIVEVDAPNGGLALSLPGDAERGILYSRRVC